MIKLVLPDTFQSAVYLAVLALACYNSLEITNIKSTKMSDLIAFLHIQLSRET